MASSGVASGVSSAEAAPAQAAPPLAALRRSRAARMAIIRRRTKRIGVAAGLICAIIAWRSSPRPGLHGTSLGITLAICCFVLAMLLLVRLGSPFIPVSGVPARAFVPILAVLALSSGTLLILQPSGTGFAGLFMLVTITARVFPRRLSAMVLAACLAFFTVPVILGQSGWRGPTGVVGLFALLAVYTTSLFARRIRVQEELEERLLAELEESRNAELRAAALAERQRLAREMHDVLAHSLSGLVVQLEGTRLLATTAPGDQRLPAAIDRAHQLARSGLEEARQAIGMLRGDELPGPGRLAELAAEFGADTGIPCRFTEAGTPRELASAVVLALYRVTQEGLTNVRKHARPDRVEVRLEYLPEAVTLGVQDFGTGPAAGGVALGAGPFDGTGGAALGDGTGGTGTGGTETGCAGTGCAGTGAGYGLTGMRERAGLLGGSLDASRTSDGFRVLLRVPA
ncbi:MAG: sensor histidine kinase [Trebonia sp.]